MCLSLLCLQKCPGGHPAIGLILYHLQLQWKVAKRHSVEYEDSEAIIGTTFDIDKMYHEDIEAELKPYCKKCECTIRSRDVSKDVRSPRIFMWKIIFGRIWLLFVHVKMVVT